jgi:single-stranded-DNA-specific exonuclease
MTISNALAAGFAHTREGPEQTEYALGVARSFGGRAWHFRAYDADVTRQMELKGLSSTLARVLAARGVAADEAELFLAPKIRALLTDPLALHDMATAVARFTQAIAGGEIIGVLADYDVDGSASAAFLLRFLRGMGRETQLHIPDRLKDGYGPSPAAMRDLQARGCKLVVTVDCGAAAHEALDEARKLGLDVIVLDHHKVETNPPAFAHVNPNGPDDKSGLNQLAATGVTFVFLVAVHRHLREQGWYNAQSKQEPDLIALLDLVALATITDVVPLTGINRAFVRQGLKILDALERPGMAALARVSSIAPPFTPYHLGFMFGPRINAGGRVGRSNLGAMLLATDDLAEADRLAEELNRHNRERQAIEAGILEQAEALALHQEDAPFVLVTGEGWHAGVVGIIAGRLRERHNKPALVVGFENGLGRGSARSVAGVDLGAIIRAAREAQLLETGGGHAMAAGFSVKNERLKDFTGFLQESLEPQRERIAAAKDLYADALASVSGATLALINDLTRAGPFGAGNPEPMFVLPDVTIAYADIVGTNHVRLRLLARDGASLGAIAFRSADAPLGQGLLKSRGKRVHVAGKLKTDNYKDEPRVQLHVEDAAPAGA